MTQPIRRSLLLCMRSKKFTQTGRSFCLFLTVGATLTFLLLSLHQILWQTHFTMSSFKLQVELQSTKEPLPESSVTSEEAANQSDAAFRKQYQRQFRSLSASLYRFDRPGLLLPLMRLSKHERSRAHRVAAGRAWLRSQSVVVAATVRNGMAGLPSSTQNVRRLRALFNASWLVLVENDSIDMTRNYLYNMTLTDPTMTLLGCGRINSEQPCKINIRYGSGRKHVPGHKLKRSFSEEVERGLVMSALRNQYLDYIYEHLANRTSLLLVIDPDISWIEWDLDNIAQGAYYFAVKPQLQQLCAHTTYGSNVFDPCTLSFHINKRFGEDTKYPVVSYEKSLRNAPSSLPPVKVESCFQAMSFYRMSDLAARSLHYERSPGEWMCEHNTLSRQLHEVYIDPQMRLRVKDSNSS